MSNEFIQKLEESVKKLEDKKNRIYFLVQDTKGNAKASIKYIYDMAYVLFKGGYNIIIIHEQNDYKGVGSWLSEKYMEIPHKAIEGQNLEISPEDFVVIPELYGHVMEQISKLPCGKIVLSQSYDYMLETLPPGSSWSQYGFIKCITTTNEQKEYLDGIMKNISFDIITPYISENFKKKSIPPKPIVSVHTREQRDTMKLIKSFYLKYPQFRWITFRDMRGLPEHEFASLLEDSFVSVWIDDVSSFGTFPLESMKTGTPVIGKIPNIKPYWMNENNGIWVNDILSMVDVLAEFVQNWLEDNISEKLYESGFKTSNKYSNPEVFESLVVSTFNDYINKRLDNFKTQLEKIKEQ
jgi:uncharacterized protein with HEPN domain